MSGIYIKGMEMPKAGNWKTIRIYYDGTCAEPNWQGDCKVMKGCEAVPVPDHGDLIDRDELINRVDLFIDSAAGVANMAVWAGDVADAPAVIPAERSEDAAN